MSVALALLKALADPTRLRIVALLRRVELAVSDMTRILRQSQPRVSRHLKILADDGIIDRNKEGAWVYLRLTDRPDILHVIEALEGCGLVDAAQARADQRELEAVLADRQAAAQTYFAENAAAWDRVRSMHISETEVEAAVSRHLLREPVETLLDLGTGTGRMLELFGPHIRRGIGVDMSPEMLKLARAKLEAAGLGHCQVRLGDMYALPDGLQCDAVIMHQVLHFADDPGAAIVEAAQQLATNGRLLVVDFAAHENQLLLVEHQHRRLGFGDPQIADWMAEAGLDIEVVEALPSQLLTVKLWIGRRTRTAAMQRTAA